MIVSSSATRMRISARVQTGLRRRKRTSARVSAVRCSARASRAARRGRARGRSRGPVPCGGSSPIPAPSSVIASSDLAVVAVQLDLDVRAAVLERVAEQLREDERERGRAVAGERAPARARPSTSRPAPTPWTSIARSRSSRSARSTSSSRCSVSTSCTAAIARIRLTESSSAFRGSIAVGVARLQPQQRGHGLQVVLDPVVDLLGEHAAHHGAPVLERDRRLLGDRARAARGRAG